MQVVQELVTQVPHLSIAIRGKYPIRNFNHILTHIQDETRKKGKEKNDIILQNYNIDYYVSDYEDAYLYLYTKIIVSKEKFNFDKDEYTKFLKEDLKFENTYDHEEKDDYYAICFFLKDFYDNFYSKGTRPVYVANFKQRVSDHYAFVCGMTMHHLTNIGIIGGMYKNVKITRINFDKLQLTGSTKLSDSDIVFICERNVGSSNNLSFRNCQNFVYRCIKEVCIEKPTVDIDLSTAKSSQYLSNFAWDR